MRELNNGINIRRVFRDEAIGKSLDPFDFMNLDLRPVCNLHDSHPPALASQSEQIAYGRDADSDFVVSDKVVFVPLIIEFEFHRVLPHFLKP